MSRDFSSSITAHLLRGLAGRGPASATPPRTWCADDALAVSWSRPLLAYAVATAAPLGRVIDCAVEFTIARWALVVGLAVAALAGMRLGIAPAETNAVAGTAAAALVLIIGATLVLRSAAALHEGRTLRTVGRLLVAGLALRVACAAVLASSGGLPDEWGIYHPVAMDAATAWADGHSFPFRDMRIVQARGTYFVLLSFVYAVTTPALLVGRALGIAIGLAAALIGGELARRIAGSRAAVIAVGLLALHPEHALWSTTLSRDSLTTLLVLTTLAIVALRPGSLLRGNIVPACVPLLLLMGNAFVVAGTLAAVLLALLLGEALWSAPRSAIHALTAVVVTAGALAALVFVGHRYGLWFTPNGLGHIHDLSSDAGPDFLPGFRFDGMWQVLLYLPLGAAFVIAAPFPWAAVHAHRAAYGVAALAGLALSVVGVVGLWHAARRNLAVAAGPVLFVILLWPLLGLIETTSGIVVRHRLPLTAVLTIGAAVLLAGHRRRPLAGPGNA